MLPSSLAFVAGFSVVFTAFGASASAVGQFLVRNKVLLAPVAGAIIVLFGLHLIGWLGRISIRWGITVGALLVLVALLAKLRPGLLGLGGDTLVPVQLVAMALIFLSGPYMTRWFNRDIHFRALGGQTAPNPGRSPLAGLTSGFLMGFAFAFGWTPCIGPILAAVLAMAATAETIGHGVFLLAVSSAGLAIPFLLTALGIGQFLRFRQRFSRYLHAVEVSSGVLLLLVGSLIFANRLTWLSGKLSFLNYFAR